MSTMKQASQLLHVLEMQSAARLCCSTWPRWAACRGTGQSWHSRERLLNCRVSVNCSQAMSSQARRSREPFDVCLCIYCRSQEDKWDTESTDAGSPGSPGGSGSDNEDADWIFVRDASQADFGVLATSDFLLVLRDTGDPVQIAPSRIAPFSLAELRITPKHTEWDLLLQVQHKTCMSGRRAGCQRRASVCRRSAGLKLRPPNEEVYM